MMPEIERLVLIDDDPGVLRAVGLLLQTMHFTVVPFSSPSAALAHVKAGNKVDLVITDLRMPEISGEQVLHELRSHDRELPVIVMSGHTTAKDVAALRLQGAAACISKPFTPSQFKQLVDQMTWRLTAQA